MIDNLADIPRFFPAIPRRRIKLFPGEISLTGKEIIAGRTVVGPDVIAFEKAFAAQLGLADAVSFNSGRTALRAILLALKIPFGSEIILPSYTDQSVPQTLRDLGFMPIFVDIEPDSHNLDPDLVEAAIGSQTKAIIATHLFGRPCRIDRIMSIARKAGVPVIEDCAHSFGATFQNRKVGTIGDAAFFSFAATKVFATLGGGMAVSSDPKLMQAIRIYAEGLPQPRQMGIIRKVVSIYLLALATHPWFFGLIAYPLLRAYAAFNIEPKRIYDVTFRRLLKASHPTAGRIANLQSRLGREKLAHLDEFTGLCRKNALKLDSLLAPEIRRLQDPVDAEAVYYFFVVLHTQHRELAKSLLRSGIDTGNELMRNCAAMPGESTRYPVTEAAVSDSLQIPIFPLLESEIEKVAQIINRLYRAD